MAGEENNSKLLSRASGIEVGLAIAVAVLIGGYIMSDVRWKSAVDSRLTSIDKTIAVAAGSRWRREHMILWAERLKYENPELAIPDIADILEALPDPTP